MDDIEIGVVYNAMEKAVSTKAVSAKAVWTISSLLRVFVGRCWLPTGSITSTGCSYTRGWDLRARSR